MQSTPVSRPWATADACPGAFWGLWGPGMATFETPLSAVALVAGLIAGTYFFHTLLEPARAWTGIQGLAVVAGPVDRMPAPRPPQGCLSTFVQPRLDRRGPCEPPGGTQPWLAWVSA